MGETRDPREARDTRKAGKARSRGDGSFLVSVARLLRTPGGRRAVQFEAVIPELSITSSQVPDGETVSVDLVLESVSGAILVTGTVTAPFEGSCRRCLVTARGTLRAEVRELVGHEPDPETEYVLSGDLLDLEPIVHDACILELPLAPLCTTSCLGLCPECGSNRNIEPCSCLPVTDVRWAALAGLNESEVSEGADPPRGRAARAGGEPDTLSEESDDGRPEEEDLQVEEP
jgi:uncharacterized protein